MTVQTPQAIRDFWFAPENQPFWFEKSDDFDQQVISQFGDTYEAAALDKLPGWLDDPQDALALVIALDQFPRNMFRGSPRSFESNDLALRYARAALDRGYDKEIEEIRRPFLYLPFMHSEDLADQDLSVHLYEAYGNENNLKFAQEHRDIIARFGRFPHRNAVLGREDTPEEAEFLQTHKGF